MKPKTRIYDTPPAEHLAKQRRMAFVSGPRQVGKNTTYRVHGDTYIDWDNIDDRESILAGPARLIDHYRLDRLSKTPRVVIFDELHKFSRWKQFLQGFFDTCADRLHIIVTVSSRSGGRFEPPEYYAQNQTIKKPHSVNLTTSPPNEVSLNFSDISSPVCVMAAVQLSSGMK